SLTAGVYHPVLAHLPGVDRVIPCMLPGPPDAKPSEKTGFPSLIYLGSRGSRKRGEAALDLFLRLRPIHPGLRLHYVGSAEEVRELRKRPEYTDVDFHSRLTQDELAALYRKGCVSR